jgi:hypothetical protein
LPYAPAAPAGAGDGSVDEGMLAPPLTGEESAGNGLKQRKVYPQKNVNVREIPSYSLCGGPRCGGPGEEKPKARPGSNVTPATCDLRTGTATAASVAASKVRMIEKESMSG